MVPSNDWTPVTIVLRRHLGLLALLPFLLSSCADRSVTTEPGVLTSGYWIPDGIAVIGEHELLFADRGGALHHYVDGRVTGVRGLPPSRTSGVYGGLLDVSLHPTFADSRLVYIAYTNSALDLSVARFELREDRAENVVGVRGLRRCIPARRCGPGVCSRRAGSGCWCSSWSRSSSCSSTA